MKAFVLAGVWLLGCADVLAQRNAPGAVEWNALLPTVQEVVKKELPEAGLHQHYVATVLRTDDVTGDGRPEALIDLGCCGAYTHEITVMRIEDGKPVLALFRGSDGKVSTEIFAEGSSVMNGEAVELMPQEQAVFSGHWSMRSDGKKLRVCTGEVYRWNGAEKRFDFNQKLSKRLTQDFCRKTEAQLVGSMQH